MFAKAQSSNPNPLVVDMSGDYVQGRKTYPTSWALVRLVSLPAGMVKKSLRESPGYAIYFGLV